jgi:CheY-like chemotaxis protein
LCNIEQNIFQNRAIVGFASPNSKAVEVNKMTNNHLPSEVKRILCVDDDKEACVTMRAFLDLCGYEAVTATSVPEALEQASLGGFGLCLLDTWIGAETGLDLCHRIRSFDQKTPVIFFYSGAGFKTVNATEVGAGAQAYITKKDANSLEKIVGQHIL